jgi:hypothetical protein
MSKEVKVQNGQSMFDLAIQHYGSVEGLFLLMEDNAINSVNHNFVDGELIQIKSDPINQTVVNYYLNTGLIVNSTFEPNSIPLVAPTIVSIAFAPLTENQTKNITITGTNFTSGSTVSISKGTNSITVNSVTVNSSTQIIANITTGTVTGGFDVTVNNGLSVTSLNGISVSAAIVAPTITSIAFAPLTENQTKNITITGTNFTSGSTVSISKGTNSIAVNSVTVNSSTQISANITTGTVTGAFDVTVNNGLSITEVDGISVSAAVVVPTITNISFAPLLRNQTKDITITGTNFGLGSAVTIFKGSNSITVNTVTRNSSTQLTVNVTTTSNIGSYDVTITSSGQSATEVDGIDVIVVTTIPGVGSVGWTNVSTGMVTTPGRIEWSSSAPLQWENTGSFLALPANIAGYLEFKIDNSAGYSSGGFFIGGLSLTPGGTHYTSVEYPFYYEQPSASRISVLRNGGRENPTSGHNLNHVLRIERNLSGVVSFYINGVIFYTHPDTTLAALYFNCRINRYLAADELVSKY